MVGPSIGGPSVGLGVSLWGCPVHMGWGVFLWGGPSMAGLSMGVLSAVQLHP